MKHQANTRIVTRELAVLSRSRNGDPVQFAVIEHLSCGHRRTNVLIEWQDLIAAYSENPKVRARRRWCRACDRRQQKPA